MNTTFRALRPASFLGVLALIACTLCTRAVAQPVPFFEDHIPQPAGYDLYRTKSCIGPSGSIYVAAEMAKFGTETVNDADLLVSRIGSDGSILWQDQIPNPPEILIIEDLHKFVATPDGGALAGIEYTDDDLGYASVNRLIKFAPDGTIQWTRVTDSLLDLFVQTDGTIFTTDYKYIHGGTDGLPTVSKITSDGQFVWSQAFGVDEGYENVSNLASDGKGGVTALGWADGYNYNADDSTTNVFGIFPLDFTGNNADGGTAISNVSFNGLYVAASTRDAAGNFFAFGTISNNYVLVKMDASGNPVWQTPLASGTSIHKILLDNLGNIVLWISTGTQTPTYNLAKYDANGNFVWSIAQPHTLRDFIADPGGELFVLAQLPNGSMGMIKYLPTGDLGWPSQPYGAVIFSSTAASNSGDEIQRDNDGRLYMDGNYSDYPVDTGRGILVGKYGPANDAIFKSQTVPGTMVAGQSYTMVEAFTNMGIANWISANGFYLRSSNPVDNNIWGTRHVDLAPADSIAIGQSKYFTFNVIAPMNAGSYNTQWRMSQTTHAFGSTSTNKVVSVVVRQNAARYVSETIPGSVKAGSTFSVTVNMMNVGTTAWTSTAGFGLAPLGATTWGVTKVATGATSIARGATKAFTFTCHAPATAGSYHMQFQMRRDATSFTGVFGDLSPQVTVTVTP